MRWLSAALVISVAAHGALLAWMCSAPPAGTPAPHRAEPPAPPAPPAPVDAPMVVEIVQLPAASSAGDLGTPGEHRVAITTAGHGTGGGGAHETRSGGAAGGADLMKMRGRDAPPAGGLSPEFIEKFLAASKPVPPKDTEAERVADDLASERDKLNDPAWVAHASPDEVMAMRQALVADLDRRDHLELKPAGGGRFKSEHTVHDMNGLERESFGVTVAPDGTVTFHDAPNLQGHGLAGSFDATDWAMRSHGDDPYAHQKLEWLDQTRDDRVAIGKRHEHEVLAHTPEYVQRNLEWAWQRTSDLAQHKRDLFDLWDDCAESGDDELIAAGNAARLYIIGFIRAKLPAGSADAYTAAELAELNAHRHSQEVFAPYVTR